MTNGEKFKEVFGFTQDKKVCVAPLTVCEIFYAQCGKGCPFDDWWNKEYKPCFRMKEEFE